VATKANKAAQGLGPVEIGGGMSWDKFVKKYVWDDTKTPYFVRVAKLNKVQAGYELFSYSLFLAILFGVISVVTLSDQAPQGRSEVVSIYAFCVVCGAIVLAMTKSSAAALVCASAPLAALLYFFLKGFPSGLGMIDHWVLVAAALGLLFYSLRVVAIAKAYPDMPDAAEGE
jgi:uncharacterized membrane protein